jgi:type III restriction enzyme
MPDDQFQINASALEPLFAPWEEPSAHRLRGDRPGDPAKVVKTRRPSPIAIVNNLRVAVREWREAYYVGASDTTRQLLAHWFERPHRATTPSGEEYEFRYYYCQREAIETAIYLKEVRQINCLSQIVAEFGGPDAEIAALGITEDEDLWTRFAFKMATGSGKTKVMSLAVVWSYFHALRESDSPMARHFVVIAPNLTVYERLKEDFGGGKVFDVDPLIPSEWRGDWNMSVVLQDEASGAATGGVMYLTNIHRLYDMSKRKGKKAGETYDFMGPAVSKATALETGAALRDRITSHNRVMILNDEAHHVWDPDSAWNEAILYLHETIKSRTGGEVVAQLDFTATPKDNRGQLFKHIICDAPLGEAVDGGIVKTPVIGKGDKSLSEEPSDNAAYRYDRHLRLGYARWQRSREEWDKSGKKALLFVMCDDTKAADQITTRLNTDETFKQLNGKTINLHTNLKGKLKKIGRGANARTEFVETEKEISDEDLKALRKLSRELDENTSPYFCIVSVLMLREGWDVRNVTAIVPLRPYTSKANILPEQTLGRGLRRMTPPGALSANEVVTVVEHPAFASLYRQELAQEGLPIEIVDVDRVPSTTISIYPDEARKDVNALQIELPALTAAHRTLPQLDKLSFDDVKKAFGRYKPLPLGAKGAEDIDYEGRHLFTGEVVEKMHIHLPLLDNGLGAVSYYVKQLEQVCKVRNLHTVVAPILQTFLEEVLFGTKTSLFDAATVARLGDSDVGEHIRAVFVPLIRERTTAVEERLPRAAPQRLSDWKPYQVTHSERRPALEAQKTLFNLVPCNRGLEVALTGFAEKAADVAAFAKNAGPQCLRIDYLAAGGRLAFYTPDFFIRTTAGNCYLVETKGREDRDVPRKARAAIAWCEAASSDDCKWEYLYVPEGIFERHRSDKVEDLSRACAPALQNLIHAEETEQDLPLLAMMERGDEEATTPAEFVDAAVLNSLPPRYQDGVQQAVMLLKFFENKEGMNYAPVFTALLGSVDEAARGLITRKLIDALPATTADQKAWFDPYLQDVDRRTHRHYQNMAQNLKRTLVFKNGLSPLGLLRSCLDYALNDKTKLTGVFEAVTTVFKVTGARDLLAQVETVNDFRNTYVAHHEKDLTDRQLAGSALKQWVTCLASIHSAD